MSAPQHVFAAAQVTPTGVTAKEFPLRALALQWLSRSVWDRAEIEHLARPDDPTAEDELLFTERWERSNGRMVCVEKVPA